jgi:hypothetical protein
MKEKMTYQEIVALINEQERMIAEGKMQSPAIKYGFSAEAEKVFSTGIDVRDYFKLPKEEYENNCIIGQREVYA